MYNTLKKVGINPILHWIDNEFSTDLIHEIEVRGLKYQITPPYNHRTLLTERAIQTFKKNLSPSSMGVTLATQKTM